MAKCVSIDQHKDEEGRSQAFCDGRIQYIYRRASESRKYQAPGQDYLTFCTYEKGLAFAVCDGVGQSFCGQLAAAFLGNKLVKESDWIYANILRGESQAAEAMTRFLNQQKEEGQTLVATFALPATMSSLVKAALEGSRRYGSETMLVYGFLEHGAPQTNETEPPQLWLVWLGDTQAQILTRTGELIDLHATWTTKERWSTTNGVKGTDIVHLWHGDAQKIGRIIVYSDGIGAIVDKLATLVQEPERLLAAIEEISQAADSDDISLLDIDLLSGAEEASILSGTEVEVPNHKASAAAAGTAKQLPAQPQSPVEWEVVIVVLITVAIFVAIWLHNR